MSREPASRLYFHWDEALFWARIEAARTGLRMRLTRSRTWPTYWLIEEATA